VSAEATKVHTRLLRFTLGADESRAYWRASTADAPLQAKTAFEGYTFGQKSEARVEVILWNMRARYDAFPACLPALRALAPEPTDAKLVTHWHVMLADPLYRAFVGWLQSRRELGARDITRPELARWVESQEPGRWSGATRNGWASKLLSTAREAGLVESRKDPRPLVLPRISDTALLYLLHLLRGVHVDGTLLDNPYLRSVGLDGGALTDRLRGLPGLTLHKMGRLVDLSFDHPDLQAWAEAR
jgi:hypothetical protein